MRRIALFAALLAAGCESGPSREQVLTQFIGATEQQLVQAMGVANRTFATGDANFLAYDERRTELIAPPPGPGWGWWGWGSPWPATVRQLVCETTFEVAQGRVRSFMLRGNACG